MDRREESAEGQGRARRRPLALALAATLLLAPPAAAGPGHPSEIDQAARGPEGQDPALGAPAPAQPPYGERTPPPPGTARRGAILLLHRGGWHSSPHAVRNLRGTASRLAGYGFVVYNADYADHAAGLRDALAAYDRIRRRHPRRPICTYGESAGAHLALLVAALRPARCVVADAGPVDLNGFRPPAPVVEGGTWTLIREAFGTDHGVLERWSPSSHVDRFRSRGTRLLVGYAHADYVVPAEQAFELRAVPGAHLHHVRPTRSPSDTTRHVTWVHTRVSAASLAHYHGVQRRFLLANAP